MESLAIEKSLENSWSARGSGLNSEGMMGKKQEGGQIVRIRSMSCWMFAEFAWALRGSRLLSLKRLMVLQNADGLLKGDR